MIKAPVITLRKQAIEIDGPRCSSTLAVTIKAVLYGLVLTALAQGFLADLGYWAVGREGAGRARDRAPFRHDDPVWRRNSPPDAKLEIPPSMHYRERSVRLGVPGEWPG
ncbi:hypothetical protein [Methylococcus geothermalis]|uniref:hypothetical protein n=1 Tax=Methylococcus geothermalis TaxID=2681310 RepID=UPI00146D53AC|nr:hypothetical protein [Methylococcus geothermalis]